jgi:solute carrier family 45 protein 1/2/4
MVAIGHLTGYIIGTMDLVKIFGPAMGDTQFKQLTLVSASALILSCGVTSWAVTERILISGRDADAPNKGIFEIIRHIFKTATSLPPRIQAICNIQLWSWIGWFPFYFYSTTFVGEMYFRYDAPHDVKQSKDALGDIGRIGSLALVVFSSVVFVGATILPILIKSPDEESFTKRPPAAIAGVLTNFNKYRPDLLTAWIWGHLLFSSSMILTPFAHSFRFATFLIALCGVPSALSAWAPSTFMGIEVNRLSAPASSYRRLSITSPLELTSSTTPSPLTHLERGPLEEKGDNSSTGELSGLYFGILNIYTTIPQFIGTFISMIVFAILEPGKSPELAHDADPSEHHATDGVNAIAVCLCIGSLCTIGAAFATRRLRSLYRAS